MNGCFHRGEIYHILPEDNETGSEQYSGRPAIIVSGLRHDNGELGAFLDLIKMGGASIPVRSMVTPTSKGWTLANLLLELNTEHESVQGGNA